MSFIRELARELGDVELPQPLAPVGAYAAVKRQGELLYISGQLPMRDGELLMTGHLGSTVSLEEGRLCARWCAFNLLSQIDAFMEAKSLHHAQMVRVTGYVASAPDFYSQHLVLDDASEMFVRILGDNGLHSREALGVASLPLEAPVEISAIVAVS